jgi:hypothetical protein
MFELIYEAVIKRANPKDSKEANATVGAVLPVIKLIIGEGIFPEDCQSLAGVAQQDDPERDEYLFETREVSEEQRKNSFSIQETNFIFSLQKDIFSVFFCPVWIDPVP